MDYKKFIKYIEFSAKAHQEKALPTAATFRKFSSGEKNPYFTHPLWCAMMIFLDTQLPEKIRVPGAEALLLHDVLEDTSSPLPRDISKEVKHLVKEMTYKGGFNEEKTAVLKKPPVVQLLKLYDKAATLYDSGKQRDEWIDFTKKLIKTVEREYGQLNIVLLAERLIKKYKQKQILINKLQTKTLASSECFCFFKTIIPFLKSL